MVTRATNLIIVGDFNGPSVNWKDMTMSSHKSKFDARLLSFCLDNFVVQHSILAIRSILGQRENCLDLVFTYYLYLLLGNSAHLSQFFDDVCSSCLNTIKKQKTQFVERKGKKRHLHLQNWDTMLVGDIEIKWLGLKTVLLDLVENVCPLARSKHPLAKPWLSMHIVAMQKQKKKLYKFCLAYTFPRSLGLLQTP